MTIVELSRRVELHFWDWIIPALSASPILQHGLCITYRLMRKAGIYRKYILGTGMALLGFTNGILLYWLVAR